MCPSRSPPPLLLSRLEPLRLLARLFWPQSWAFMELLARAAWQAGLSREKRDLADLGRHKILKSHLAALSKADARWYIPPATPGHSLRVAFSGSLRTGNGAPKRWPASFRQSA